MKTETILETLQNKYIGKEIEVWCYNINNYEFVSNSYNVKLDKNIIPTLTNVIVERVDVDYYYEEHEFRIYFTYNNKEQFIDLKNE